MASVSLYHRIEVNGEPATITEWSERTGVPAQAILTRLNVLGWAPEDAVNRRPVTPRPSNDEYFIRIAAMVALRSTCARRAVGCVIVNKHRDIISTGYNSVAGGMPHCTDSPCEGAGAKSGEGLHLCQSRHAEDVALMKCSDIRAIDTLYCTASPCVPCTRRLLDTSCRRIVFAEPYPSDAADVWRGAGREWYQLKAMIAVE